MGKKSDFIRIRADDELKRALKLAADLQDRKEADQARYILRRALGLIAAEEIEPYTLRPTAQSAEQKVPYAKARSQPTHKKTGNHDG